MAKSSDVFRIQPDASDDSAQVAASFGAVWTLARRHRLLLLAVPMAALIGAVMYGVLRHRSYTSTAAFIGTSSDATRAGLSGIAAQFGVRVPTGDATQSPQFYADLIRSHQVLDAVAATPFHYRSGGTDRQVRLDDVFEASGKTPALRRENTIAALDRNITVGIGRETGVVRISVSTPDPALSVVVAERLLELINTFNLESRQSRASAERKFTQARMQEVESELRASEARLEAFRRENRQYLNSPDLIGQNERLQRDVSMRQQIFTSLVQAYEQARIDEVRDTPVITVIEAPYLPARPDQRGLIRLALMGFVLGLIFGAGFAAVLEVWTSRRRPVPLAA